MRKEHLENVGKTFHIIFRATDIMKLGRVLGFLQIERFESKLIIY